jgi:hypothetical protein
MSTGGWRASAHKPLSSNSSSCLIVRVLCLCLCACAGLIHCLCDFCFAVDLITVPRTAPDWFSEQMALLALEEKDNLFTPSAPAAAAPSSSAAAAPAASAAPNYYALSVGSQLVRPPPLLCVAASLMATSLSCNRSLRRLFTTRSRVWWSKATAKHRTSFSCHTVDPFISKYAKPFFRTLMRHS